MCQSLSQAQMDRGKQESTVSESGNLHPHTIVETDVKHEHLLTHGLSVRNQSIECCEGLSKEPPSLAQCFGKCFSEEVLGILRWLSGKELVYHCRRHKRCEFYSWIMEIPWNRKWQPSPVFLPCWGFSGGSVVKNWSIIAGDTRYVSLIPGSGRSRGTGNANPLQYSCQENLAKGGQRSLAGYSPWGLQIVGHN